MFNHQIQRLKKEIRKLKELVYKDELTNLYNRRGFKEEAKKFIEGVSGYREKPGRRKSLLIKNFSLIIFDVDNLKKINDVYCHQTGDKALKMLSKIITEKVRDIDIVARWGGEEILVGLIGASEKDAFIVADDIRKKVDKTPLKWQDKEIKFTVSGGIAAFGKESKTFEELFKKADSRLYKAKKSGKNYIWYGKH
jgi:diguanylate cyclase (GGDEF)-like protein